MATNWKKAGATRLRSKVLKAIDRRCTGGGAGATKTELRLALESAFTPDQLRSALAVAGLTMRKASADDLHKLNYGLAWSRAYGRPLAEFYASF